VITQAICNGRRLRRLRKKIGWRLKSAGDDDDSAIACRIRKLMRNASIVAMLLLAGCAHQELRDPPGQFDPDYMQDAHECLEKAKTIYPAVTTEFIRDEVMKTLTACMAEKGWRLHGSI